MARLGVSAFGWQPRGEAFPAGFGFSYIVLLVEMWWRIQTDSLWYQVPGGRDMPI